MNPFSLIFVEKFLRFGGSVKVLSLEERFLLHTKNDWKRLLCCGRTKELTWWPFFSSLLSIPLESPSSLDRPRRVRFIFGRGFSERNFIGHNWGLLMEEDSSRSSSSFGVSQQKFIPTSCWMLYAWTMDVPTSTTLAIIRQKSVDFGRTNDPNPGESPKCHKSARESAR